PKHPPSLPPLLRGREGGRRVESFSARSKKMLPNRHGISLRIVWFASFTGVDARAARDHVAAVCRGRVKPRVPLPCPPGVLLPVPLRRGAARHQPRPAPLWALGPNGHLPPLRDDRDAHRSTDVGGPASGYHPRVTTRPSRPAARRARRAAPNLEPTEVFRDGATGRPDKSAYAMILAFAAALRSACLSRKVGCLIVRDSQVIATGYNGTPSKTWHPEEFPKPCPCVGGISGADLAMKYCAHAEANALAQSAYRGASTSGADIFCTNLPC